MMVVIRADASLAIGSGHVMRCLTLGDALVQRGHSCVFVSRDVEGHLGEVVRARGHDLVMLEGRSEPYREGESAPPHGAWLGCHWLDDAAATAEVVERRGADVLAVDHYALDQRWEGSAGGADLVVIDDLADRPHGCRLLIDQNLGRVAAAYDGLVPEQAGLLLGPDYAMVAPPFTGVREGSLSRRAGASLEHLMISMGGVDGDNATGAVLDSLGRHLPGSLRTVSVIMGRHAPHQGQVRAAAAELPIEVEVAVGVDDMAERMARADLAVGGAGVTAWERCAVGLPSIAVVLAENQRPGATALGEAGAALVIEDALDIAARFPELLDQLGQPETRARVSRAAANLVDGGGLTRIVTAMEELRV